MYTMQEATREVLKDLTPGTKYTGRDLHTLILHKLRVNGNNTIPYDSSTLRSVRRFASLYGVVCDKAGRNSKYVKETLL